jgi:lysophospholipase L1-like esterase
MVLGIAVLLTIGVTYGAAAPAGAASNEVLILGPTVSGGESSVEASEVTAQGLTPVIVDAATWRSMTTAQFSNYRAIILGDATCDFGDPSAAIANHATWGAAITGNVIINGTDPVFHDGQGGNALTRHSVDFAIAQTDKTGLYASLSCYFHDIEPHTPVPMLDGLSPGGFTVTGVGCYNDAHIVATHPALAGLTDAELSNWSCSVHEAFDAWPPEFTVLAIAKDFGAAYTASDGTVGTPYILARGAGLRSFPLSLDPTSQSVDVGASARVTAQLLDGATSAPVAGSVLRFRVASGPNASATGTCVPASCATDTAGHVAWSYIGTTAGTDTVQTWLDANGDGAPTAGEPQTTAAVTWMAATRDTAYVALGDSYSAGEGLYPYLSGSDQVSPRNTCHRSEDAYGPLLHRDVPSLGAITFAACSGAVTDDFYVTNPNNNGEPRQLDRLGAATKVVTLTIGGNDAGFEDVLTKCIYGPEAPGARGCAKDETFVTATQARISALATGRGKTTAGRPIHALHTLLADIHHEAPNARIYIANYPRLFGNPPENGGKPLKQGQACEVGSVTEGLFTAHYRIGVEDIDWINELSWRLNRKILDEVKAAQKAGVPAVYATASREFLSHGLCDRSSPWIQGLLIDPVAKKPQSGSFHPTEDGQQLGLETAFRKAGIR